MDDLIAFLRARILEDEAEAHLAKRGWSNTLTAPGGIRSHVKRWSPDRVLAEVAAKRQIIDRWSNDAKYPNFDGGYESAIDDVLALLALPYADHPDYREEWRP